MGQVTLTLNGRTYRVGCDDGEEQRLGALGAYLRGKLETVVRDFGQVGEARLLLLTALMISDELYETRAERDMAASKAAVAALRDTAERAKPETKAAPMLPAQPEATKSSLTPASNSAVGEKKLDDPVARTAKLEEPKPALSSLQAAMNRQSPPASPAQSPRKAV